MTNKADELVLTVWLHPSMKVPFKFDAKDHPFKISPNNSVVELMDSCEVVFGQQSQNAGMNLELQINVLWNIKNHKKALNPTDKLGKHFVTGDTFGVYGDIQSALSPNFKSEEAKIPVTILTGFLGSGKTTLLNYILQEQNEKKIAIIENEFGEISIDDALLKKQKMNLAEKVVVMDNGCMCCTIRGDLVNGLKEIIDEIQKGTGIEAIMIETTGMADPVPIVKTFMGTQEITDELRLDAVVTMADAKHLTARLDDPTEEGKVNEAYQQIAFSDKIILNKLDLVTTEQAIACKDRIRDVNKYAKILPSVRGQVKLSELVNIRAHDMTNFVNEDIDKEAEVVAELVEGHGEGHGRSEEEHGHGGGHSEAQNNGHGNGHGTAHGVGHGNANKKSRHDSRVNSFSIWKEGEILPMKLSQWMASLGELPADKGTIFRIKAILAVKGHPYKHVFHAVMDVSDEDDAGPWEPGEKKVSKIVFIGKSMDQQFLRKGFEAIFES